MIHHSDDVSVENFATEMKIKLALCRLKGKGGWDDPNQCSLETLVELLESQFAKGDLVDVANLCMMLHQRGVRNLSIATN